MPAMQAPPIPYGSSTITALEYTSLHSMKVPSTHPERRVCGISTYSMVKSQLVGRVWFINTASMENKDRVMS